MMREIDIIYYGKGCLREFFGYAAGLSGGFPLQFSQVFALCCKDREYE